MSKYPQLQPLYFMLSVLLSSTGKAYLFFTFTFFFYFPLFSLDLNGTPELKLAEDRQGLSKLIWGNEGRNYIDKGKVLGAVELKFTTQEGIVTAANTADYAPLVLKQAYDDIQLLFNFPEGINLKEEFRYSNGELYWNIEIQNNGSGDLTLRDLSFPLPIGSIDRSLQAKDNLTMHKSVNGDASFCYWIPFSGEGDILLMTVQEGTSLEYFAHNENNKFFIHSSTSVDRINDSWRLPSTTGKIASGKQKKYGFKFRVVQSIEEVRESIYADGCLDVRAIPGMTLPNNLSAFCAIRGEGGIDKLEAEYPNETEITYVGKRSQDYHVYEISFAKLGENLVTVHYGKGKVAYLDFFITEPLETLIKKRSSFITHKQQHRDASKWYDGLYSIWDMERSELLSPDYKHQLPDYVVGGSDDPSNGKALYVSEKNIAYPDQKEIAALEYYEEHFVWGGLQRTDEEYPYPYGIYGSENWYENRSGKVAGYNSGGWGKERLWRTFDYTTHIALYYNLYLIARDHPHMVKYLDAAGYLERAYRTAMAFFLVPYNIKMGEDWSFNGWTDWAYKQGNFHERYIINLIDELEKHGEEENADALRREWEKKVKYFIYDDPWPFGSEMYVDRTAYESSYYIAEYAKEHEMKPQEQLWYDKNKCIWYSHTSLSDSATDVFIQKQLRANLALRGIIEPGYSLLGSARVGTYTLDYMSQMGGAAIIDYGLKFSTTPYKYINIGYNSMLSSWALMNTGDENNGYGYWYPSKANDGAVGWTFTQVQNGTTWWKHIKAKRGPWRYCGEIDHGLTSGVHDLSTIVLRDPVFGLVAYGGELKETNGWVRVVPRDGVRKQAYFLMSGQKVSVRMVNDGLKKAAEIGFSKSLDHLVFQLENRSTIPHKSTVIITGLKPGEYNVRVGDRFLEKLIVRKEVRDHQISIPLSGNQVQVEIITSKAN